MASTATITRMTYRFLGNSGLLVSKLGLGSWMSVDEKNTPEAWYAMMKLAFAHGITFFDNADVYGEGLAEKNMGAAIKTGIADGTWSREDLVITTKLGLGLVGFHGAKSPNTLGLSRKHIVEGMKASLKRLQLDYVDVIYCIRPDPYTPIEETVRAMNYVIDQGWAFYWGTSQWNAADIVEAIAIADRLGLARPIVEQSVYNLFDRTKVELEYADLYKKYKLGLSTWGPLAWGTLTGKHSSGTVKGSRMDNAMFKAAVPDFDERVVSADKLKTVADELGITLPELALAWCVSNENVSTVLIGARNLAQLESNLKALPAVEKITPEVKAKIESLVPFVPKVTEHDPPVFRRKQFL